MSTAHFRHALIVLLAGGALGCSSSSGGAGTGGASKKGESCAKTADCASDLKCINQVCVPSLPAGFCQSYETLCPGGVTDVSACEFDCVTNASLAASDDCWFKACGAEVGKCDNAEPNDQSILACAAKHGWE
jgi:hypothetical protein